MVFVQHRRGWSCNLFGWNVVGADAGAGYARLAGHAEAVEGHDLDVSRIHPSHLQQRVRELAHRRCCLALPCPGPPALPCNLRRLPLPRPGSNRFIKSLIVDHSIKHLGGRGRVGNVSSIPDIPGTSWMSPGWAQALPRPWAAANWARAKGHLRLLCLDPREQVPSTQCHCGKQRAPAV